MGKQRNGRAGERRGRNQKNNVHWMVVAVLFFVTLINYMPTADRASISLAGPGMAKELGLSVVDMGFIFSAFGWAYVIFQLPGGWTASARK